MFRKPSAKKVGLKCLVLGEKGTGKSVFALSFPRVNAVDAETGMAWYEGHAVFGRNLEGIANTQNFEDLQDAIEIAMDMGVKEIGTLVIDSETKIYQNLTDASLQLEEKKARDKGKDVMDSAVSMRGWGRIKSVAQRLQNLKIDLSAKGVNVVSIAQIDDVKKKVGENFVKIGEKPVMQKGSEYDYDIVVKLFTEMDAKGEINYKGEILKDRTGVTKVGQIVDNPSYETWSTFVEGRKDADTIDSNLAGDFKKATNALEQEDAEAEKTALDKIKELVAKSDAHKAKITEMITAAKIDLTKLDAKSIKKLEEIVEVVSKI